MQNAGANAKAKESFMLDSVVVVCCGCVGVCDLVGREPGGRRECVQLCVRVI